MSGRRLGTIIRVRRLQERLARADVARTRAELATRVAHEDHLWCSLADRAAAMPTTPHALRAHRQMLTGGVAEAHRAGEHVVAARDRVDEALAHWTGATQRREGIERLADRIADAEHAERERRAGVELDDLVIARWNRS